MSNDIISRFNSFGSRSVQPSRRAGLPGRNMFLPPVGGGGPQEPRRDTSSLNNLPNLGSEDNEQDFLDLLTGYMQEDLKDLSTKVDEANQRKHQYLAEAREATNAAANSAVEGSDEMLDKTLEMVAAREASFNTQKEEIRERMEERLYTVEASAINGTSQALETVQAQVQGMNLSEGEKQQLIAEAQLQQSKVAAQMIGDYERQFQTQSLNVDVALLNADQARQGQDIGFVQNAYTVANGAKAAALDAQAKNLMGLAQLASQVDESVSFFDSAINLATAKELIPEDQGLKKKPDRRIGRDGDGRPIYIDSEGNRYYLVNGKKMRYSGRVGIGT